MDFQLSSTVFPDNGMIPKRYSGQGPDISPSLNWSGVPAGTKSLALILDDPDAPLITFVHWLVYNIPPAVGGLPENLERSDSLADGSKQGKNTFLKAGSRRRSPLPGPCNGRRSG